MSPASDHGLLLEPVVERFPSMGSICNDATVNAGEAPAVPCPYDQGGGRASACPHNEPIARMDKLKTH